MCEVEKLTDSAKNDLKYIARMSNLPGMFDVEKQLQGLFERVQDPTKFEDRLIRIEAALSWKYLKIPPTPYLPQKASSSIKHTLVLDLDETLIYY
jgi:hypothetical protein